MPGIATDQTKFTLSELIWQFVKGPTILLVFIVDKQGGTHVAQHLLAILTSAQTYHKLTAQMVWNITSTCTSYVYSMCKS